MAQTRKIAAILVADIVGYIAHARTAPSLATICLSLRRNGQTCG